MSILMNDHLEHSVVVGEWSCETLMLSAPVLVARARRMFHKYHCCAPMFPHALARISVLLCPILAQSCRSMSCATINQWFIILERHVWLEIFTCNEDLWLVELIQRVQTKACILLLQMLLDHCWYILLEDEQPSCLDSLAQSREPSHQRSLCRRSRARGSWTCQNYLSHYRE